MSWEQTHVLWTLGTSLCLQRLGTCREREDEHGTWSEKKVLAECRMGAEIERAEMGKHGVRIWRYGGHLKESSWDGNSAIWIQANLSDIFRIFWKQNFWWLFLLSQTWFSCRRAPGANQLPMKSRLTPDSRALLASAGAPSSERLIFVAFELSSHCVAMAWPWVLFPHPSE